MSSQRSGRLFDKMDALFQLTIYAKMVQASSKPCKRPTELGSEWVDFFDTLSAESEVVANDLPDYFRDFVYMWIEWARREFESGLPYLQHEEMFTQTQKYYPRDKKHLPREKGIWREF